MDSGLYIVTLNNTLPISVNAHDLRIAHKAIKVTKSNCKFGKAKSLRAREKNYFKTFGVENVNFFPVVLAEEVAELEKDVLARLEVFRMRGRTGRKNEWLSGIAAPAVLEIIIDTLDSFDEEYRLLLDRLPEGHPR